MVQELIFNRLLELIGWSVSWQMRGISHLGERNNFSTQQGPGCHSTQQPQFCLGSGWSICHLDLLLATLTPRDQGLYRLFYFPSPI